MACTPYSEIRTRVKELFKKLGYGAYTRRLRVYTFHALATKYLGEVGQRDVLLTQFAQEISRGNLAKNIANGLRAILVDEFQDVDESIFRILQHLQRALGTRVMAIGDDDQDILMMR